MGKRHIGDAGGFQIRVPISGKEDVGALLLERLHHKTLRVSDLLFARNRVVVVIGDFATLKFGIYGILPANGGS